MDPPAANNWSVVSTPIAPSLQPEAAPGGQFQLPQFQPYPANSFYGAPQRIGGNPTGQSPGYTAQQAMHQRYAASFAQRHSAGGGGQMVPASAPAAAPGHPNVPALVASGNSGFNDNSSLSSSMMGTPTGSGPASSQHVGVSCSVYNSGKFHVGMISLVSLELVFLSNTFRKLEMKYDQIKKIEKRTTAVKGQSQQCITITTRVPAASYSFFRFRDLENAYEKIATAYSKWADANHVSKRAAISKVHRRTVSNESSGSDDRLVKGGKQAGVGASSSPLGKANSSMDGKAEALRKDASRNLLNTEQGAAISSEHLEQDQEPRPPLLPIILRWGYWIGLALPFVILLVWLPMQVGACMRSSGGTVDYDRVNKLFVSLSSQELHALQQSTVKVPPGSAAAMAPPVVLRDVLKSSSAVLAHVTGPLPAEMLEVKHRVSHSHFILITLWVVFTTIAVAHRLLAPDDEGAAGDEDS